jgi:glucokinase
MLSVAFAGVYVLLGKGKVERRSFVAVVGDVGGTNFRLKLIRVNLETNKSETLKELTKYKANDFYSMALGIIKFLEDFEEGGPDWPSVGVVGCAGEIKDNSVFAVNLPVRWPKPEGDKIG